MYITLINYTLKMAKIITFMSLHFTEISIKKKKNGIESLESRVALIAISGSNKCVTYQVEWDIKTTAFLKDLE